MLPDGLRAEGAEVDAVTAYRNVPAKVDEAALRSEKVRKHLGDREPRKVIVVKGRLVNLLG